MSSPIASQNPYLTKHGCLDDFFVGIGDINSTFLPKLEHVVPELPPEAVITGSQPTTESPAGEEAEDDEVLLTQPTSSTPPSSEDSLASAEGEELTSDEIFTRNTMALDAQMEERPLAKKQEELLEEAAQANSASGASTNGDATTTNGGAAQATVAKGSKPVREALLKNDDTELTRLQKVNSPSRIQQHHI